MKSWCDGKVLCAREGTVFSWYACSDGTDKEGDGGGNDGRRDGGCWRICWDIRLSWVAQKMKVFICEGRGC